MRWFKKSLLWASVGCLGAASASAQTASPPTTVGSISLCRPQPLIGAAPSGIAQASAVQTNPGGTPIPAFVVRAQMAEPKQRFLPANLDAPPEARAKPDGGASTQSILPVGATAAGDIPAPDDKTFVAPAPRPFFRPFSSVNGATDNSACCTEHVTLYNYDAPGNYFNGPGTATRFYASAEYLNWSTGGYRLPILVTTAPATGDENFRGTLGVPGTVPLFGGNNTNSGPTSGARFTVGWNLDPCGTCGIEASGFFLARKNDNFFANNPVLARPFFNVNTGMLDRELTSSPGTAPGDLFKLQGTISVQNFSDFWGAEVNYRQLLCASQNYTVSGLLGFRYLDLHEGLDITENVVSQQAVPGFPIFNPGNQIVVADSFHTRNQFYGGQAGLDANYYFGRFFVGGRAQLALGMTHEQIDINGSQTITTPAGQRTTFTGGLLALPSNIGTFSQNKFAVVPQIGVRLGYNITDNVSIFAGYDFLYWSNVVRPGDQVDTRLNVSQIPNFGNNPAFVPPSNIVRPVVPFQTSSFYAHGFSVGLAVRY
jgi:hypothetical protein